MMDRYGSYLSNILMKSWDRFVKAKYHKWKSQLKDREERKQLNFYERMKIDELVRENKKFNDNLNHQAFTIAKGGQSDSSDSEEEELKMLLHA